MMFWILGLPAPVLFGAAMALFAILPVMGTSLVWVPAAIYLALSGSWIKALVLAVWGGLVVGLIDNFLYPILVASDALIRSSSIFYPGFSTTTRDFRQPKVAEQRKSSAPAHRQPHWGGTLNRSAHFKGG
jgi:hypothetical protein